MTKETLNKYLNNNCTEEELSEVIQWFKTGALRDEGKHIGFEDWKTYEIEDYSNKEEKFSLLFDKIQDKINWDSRSNISVFITWMTRVAAIFLLPVLAFLFFTLSENKYDSVEYANTIEIAAPIGSKAVVNLSDGTVVHLNYGSKLKYPQFFLGDTREVELIGEGYFDVEHNPDKPFIVKTEALNIKVLGTTFNVLAYPGDDIVETTLVNGKVVLEQNKKNDTKNVIGAMLPGQHVKYNIKSEEITSNEGSVERYIAWKDGKLVFEDTPIIQVAEKLSRMFNVDIEVADDALDNFYTVTFIDEPLFQILDMITIATPQLTYKKYSRKKLPNGTFSKQKILITEKK